MQVGTLEIFLKLQIERCGGFVIVRKPDRPPACGPRAGTVPLHVVNEAKLARTQGDSPLQQLVDLAHRLVHPRLAGDDHRVRKFDEIVKCLAKALSEFARHVRQDADSVAARLEILHPRKRPFVAVEKACDVLLEDPRLNFGRNADPGIRPDPPVHLVHGDHVTVHLTAVTLEAVREGGPRQAQLLDDRTHPVWHRARRHHPAEIKDYSRNRHSRPCPPSTGITAPVVARSASRNSTACATSSGVGRPKRVSPAGSCTSGETSTGPGATPLTRSVSANSAAAFCV